MKDEQAWKDSTIEHFLTMAYMDGFYANLSGGVNVDEHGHIAAEKAREAVESKSSEVYR